MKRSISAGYHRAVIDSLSWSRCPMPLKARLFCAIRRHLPSLGTITPDRLPLIQKAPTEGLQTFLTRTVTGFPSPDVAIHERVIDLETGPTRIRFYNQRRSGAGQRPILVYFPGGGWVAGSQASADWVASLIASDLDAVVISVGYRKAPENRFPAAVQDAIAACRWASKMATALGADPNRLGVIGDSAGATLAAVAALTLRGTDTLISHQSLIYPFVDAADCLQILSQPPIHGWDSPMLRPVDMLKSVEYYTGCTLDNLDDTALALLDDWRFSPLNADSHADLPSASIIVCGHDVLHDQGVAYASALMDANVEVRLHDFTKMPHAFLTYPYAFQDARPAVEAVIADMWHSLGTNKCKVTKSEIRLH